MLHSKSILLHVHACLLTSTMAKTFIYIMQHTYTWTNLLAVMPGLIPHSSDRGYGKAEGTHVGPICIPVYKTGGS